MLLYKAGLILRKIIGYYVYLFSSLSGRQQCMTLALRKRCKNALEKRFRRRNYARRCEINFLPVVQEAKTGQYDDDYTKRENHLKCRSNFAGFGTCPDLRTEAETADLICNPIRDNTQRCSTTHETVHTSCRMFEICDQAVIISGGWNRQTTGNRHKRNVELFYWMLRENGFKKRNIKIFFANGAEGVHSKFALFFRGVDSFFSPYFMIWLESYNKNPGYVLIQPAIFTE